MIKDLKKLYEILEPLERNLDVYTHEEIDTDMSKYRVKNSEVVGYKDHNTEINAIFRQFKAKTTEGPYIIGNYLYFTLNGVKFYTTLSCFVSEEIYLDELIKKLSPLVECIAYERGRLD